MNKKTLTHLKYFWLSSFYIPPLLFGLLDFSSRVFTMSTFNELLRSDSSRATVQKSPSTQAWQKHRPNKSPTGARARGRLEIPALTAQTLKDDCWSFQQLPPACKASEWRLRRANGLSRGSGDGSCGRTAVSETLTPAIVCPGDGGGGGAGGAPTAGCRQRRRRRYFDQALGRDGA